MKMMQGAFFLACSNMSRTRLAPTPTNISTKSEPEMVKNGTLASPATARAIRVLPVPGGPTRSTPRGLRQHLGARLAKAHRLASAALHLPRQEDPHADQRDEGQPGDQQRDEPRHVIAGGLRGDRDLAVIEALHQGRIVRRVGLERG